MATQNLTSHRIGGHQGSNRTLQLSSASGYKTLVPQAPHGAQAQTESHRFGPALAQSSSSADVVLIDLTGPPQPNASRKPTSASMPLSVGLAGCVDVMDINAVGVEAGAGTDAFNGNQLNELSQARNVVLNSRRKRQYGMGSQAPTQLAPSPSFVNPSSIQPASRGPATPTLPRTAGNARQRQFKPQPAKPAVAASASKRDNRPKPYVLETPPVAPLLPHQKHSDFFPWKGNHPEDQVTEVQAKNGQYDRPLQKNEHQPGRPALYPAFKQKSGLSTLASLFLAVLEKRQDYGRITSPSTFRPPPRVTLADHKRESWLRDLANPLVPLRRLSRTIPHGIRGRILLDHCSSKNIPPSRAIWLARCVGANELRGLKRKGASNLTFGNVEAKWIKDWTVQVVQFIDRAASECGQNPDTSWKNKMVYAIRLSAHLYSENLLDRSTFLEWYLSFLETTDLDALPLGLLMSSIYWKDLLRTRRFGHRFAEVLLGKAQAILGCEDRQIYLPLLRRLSVLITDILLGHMESLIMPRTWSRYKSTLEQCVDRSDPSVEACLQLVIRRNNNMCFRGEENRDTAPIPPQRRMIEILDEAAIPFSIDALASTCLALLPDHGEFIQCLCEWAVTSLRVGAYRVYIAAAILRRKASSGVDIQNPILAFLERFSGSAVGDRMKIYLLISELVSTKNFPLAAYFKWLISRGVLLPFTTMEKDHPCHVRLLAEIPISTAPQHLKNIRNSLLYGTGFSTGAETETLEHVKNLLRFKIGGVLGKQYPPPLASAKFKPSELEVLRGLSRHLICELSTWIRECVQRHVVEGAPVGRDNWRDLSVEVGISAITLPQFTMIRKALEGWEDFVVLADVLKQVTSSDVSGVLSSVADTVCYHIDVFSVLGVVDDILQSLFQRYKKLQLRRNIEKYVVVSMVELASFPCCDVEVRKQLQHDLDTYEKRYPRASFAHSPLSDHEFLSIMNDGDGDNYEMERLLQNGASMDKQALSRIFETMISRIESCLGENMSHLRFAFSSLIKLRHFDPTNFDKLAYEWVSKLFHNPGRYSLLETLSPLIAGSCLDLGKIVSSSLELLELKSLRDKLPGSAALELAIQVLDLIVGSSLDQSHLTDQEIYSFKRKRQAFEQNAPLDLLKIIYRAINLCVSDGNYEAESRIRNLIISKPIIRCLRILSTLDREVLISQLLEPLSKDSHPALLKWLRLLIDHLLDDHDLSDLPDPDADVQVSRLLQLANDFSIQLCQLKMRIIFDAEKSRPSCGNGLSTLTQTFFHGIASSFEEKSSVWSELVSILDENCARQVRLHAEELFLQSMTFPMPFETTQSSESFARALLAVIEATSTPVSQQPLPAISSALAEKLYMLVQHMMLPNEEPSGLGGVASSSNPLLELRPWLILFLRIIILNKSAFSNSKIGMSDQARVVVGLCSLLQNDNIQKDEALFDHILDIASFLVDELSEESRQMIRRFLRYKRQSPRVFYLFGSPDIGSIDWLKAQTRSGKLVDFPIKSWERLADPTPAIGENDTSLSLTLFRTRKVKCLKAEGEKNSFQS